MSVPIPTTPCPHCGNGEVKLYDECPECHIVFMPGDIVRAIEYLLAILYTCSRCGEKAFDGWKCHNCGAEIPRKAKTAQGCVLTGTKEVELVTTHFQKK